MNFRVLALFVILCLLAVEPAFAAVFEQVDGPYNGHVTSYVRDSGTGHLFATGVGLGLGGGVFVSTDNGDSWNRVAGNSQLGDSTVNNPQNFGVFQENIGLPSVSGLHSSMLKLGIDTNTTPNTLYVAYFFSGAPSRVMRSLDSGVTWQNFNTGLTGVTPYDFALAPNGHMYLAGFGGSGLHCLPSGAAAWVTLTTGTNNARAVAVDQVNGDIYFTNMQNSLDANKPAVFRSSNGGSSFVGVTLATSVVGGGAADAGSYNRLLNSIAIDNSISPPVVHVGFKDRWQWLTSTQIATGGHFRSTDYGATWASGTARNVESLTVDATGRVYLGTGSNTSYYGQVWRSTDRGLNFSQVAHSAINDMATVVSLQSLDANTLFAGADGPYRSTDAGVTWTRLNDRGLKANQRITEVSAASDGTLYTASNQHGVSRSLDGGATWAPANGAGASRLGSLFVNTINVNPTNGHVYAGTGLGQATARFYRSTDQGATWNQVSGYTASYMAMSNVFALNGNVVFGGLFGGPGGGHYSTDNGLTSLGSSNPVSGQPLYSMAVNPVSGHIYAGTETEATWLSTDHGVSFSPLTWATATLNGCTIQQGNKGNIFGIAVSPDGSTIYEAALRGLFRSTDNGASWQQVNVPGAGGCGQTGIGVFIDPNGYIYYQFTESTPAGPKMKRSIDGGSNWTDYNSGLPVDSRGGYGTHKMAFNPSDGKLYLGVSWPTVNIKQGTHGLFRTVLPVVAPASSPTSSPTTSPSRTATPSYSPTPAISFSSTATATQTRTSTPSPLGSATYTATVTPSFSATQTPTFSASPSPSASPSSTPSGTLSSTETPPLSPTSSSTATPSATQTADISATPSSSASPSASSTTVVSASSTATQTAILSATGTVTGSSTATQTAIQSATSTSTGSSTATLTAIVSATSTATGSSTSTATPPVSPSSTSTATPTLTSSAAPSGSASASPSPSFSASATASATATPSASSTPTPPTLGSPTSTSTLTASPSPAPANPTAVNSDAPPKLLALAVAPNPGPNSILIHLQANADDVDLRLYSAGLTALARANTGPLPAGWNRVPLPRAFSEVAPNGMNYLKATPKKAGALANSMTCKVYVVR